MGWVKSELLARLMQYWGDPRVVIGPPLSNVQDVAAARNEIVLYHYDYVAFTRLLMIDADTVPPPDFIDRMLAVDKPIVSGVTHIFKPFVPNKGGPEVKLALWQKRQQSDGTYTADILSPGAIPETGVFEDDSLLTGCFCMMISSDVLQAIKPPWFKTTYVEITQEKQESEDLYFCRRAIEAGYQVSILCDLICQHWKTTNLADVAEFGEINSQKLAAKSS